MIDLELRHHIGEQTVPLYHARGCRRVAERFARLVTDVWRCLPSGVTGKIYDGWWKYRPFKDLDEGLPAFALVPSLPRRWNADGRGRPIRPAALGSPRRGAFVFSEDWVRHATDEQVEAAVAHELTRVYEYRMFLDRPEASDLRKGRRRDAAEREKRTDALCESWGFPMASVRTWKGYRTGPPDRKRHPRSYRAWSRHQSRLKNLAESRQFNRRVQALLKGVARGWRCQRVQVVDTFAEQVQRALFGALREGCQPHKSGRYFGTKVGYDPDNHNANCRLFGNVDSGGGKRSRASKAGTKDGSPSSRAGGRLAGKSDSADVRKKKQQTAQAFKVAAAERINHKPPKTLKESCKLIRKLVRTGRKGGVPSWAVAECAAAVMFGSELRSQRKHGFDLSGTLGGKRVLLDVKHSTTTPGYHDKTKVKASKIKESAQDPNTIPAFVAFVKNRGIYLHVGLDPTQNPKFLTTKGNQGGRGLATPEGVARAIDGSGGPVPFVKLDGDYRSLDSLKKILPATLVRIRRRAAATFKGIDMDKAKDHIAKQRQAATKKAAEDLASVDVKTAANAIASVDAAATAKAVAAVDPEATARALYEAMGLTAEQTESELARLKKLTKKT